MRIPLPFANSPHRHLGLPLYTASIVISHVVAWTLPDGFLGLAASTAATALIIVGVFFWLAHSRGALCETCVEQMPLDADGQAQRRGVWLRHHHRVRATPRRVVVLTVVWVALLLGSSLLGGGPAERAAHDVLMAVVILDMWATEIHGRLSPWCPQCRGDGGWDEDEVVAPAPSTPQTA